ncbi:PEP-CTERM sorting domain-containing protein [Geobacter pickeringii]|uniref:Ice-binding protein C-terminal domain-containing protein n=1 Tax=Geobacter pickeringii TaxID=345632 RepID=A0A0B5B887_9BACT|nr:PEP-CTERM sorting domain-containing protein [Geobacter pickeringii]AJE02767.1 hypothetical protein GPICK_04740 [Geobacter pickeringii]
MKWLNRIAAFLLLASLLALPQKAPATIITFDGIPPTMVDGSGVTIGGVTIRYEGFGLGAAAIADFGPILNSPFLLGDTVGTLMLDFAIPVSRLGFTFALDAVDPSGAPVNVNPGVFAELIPPGQQFGDFFTAAASLTANTAMTGLVEGTFSHAGQPISQAFLTFDSGNSTVFVFDNLNFQPVPEPSTLLLVAAGVVGAALIRKKVTG